MADTKAPKESDELKFWRDEAGAVGGKKLDHSVFSKDITEEDLAKHESWIRASKVIYEMENGKGSATGKSNEELSEFGMSYMGSFNYNVVSMGLKTAKIKESGRTQDEKTAFMFLMDAYDHKSMSGSGWLRAGLGIVTDPTTYVGIGTLGVGTAAAQGAKAAAKVGVKALLKGGVKEGLEASTRTAMKEAVVQSIKVGSKASWTRSGLIIGGTEGALYGGYDNKKRQEIMIDSGRQADYDWAGLAKSTAGGLVLGGALGRYAPEIIKGVGTLTTKVRSRFPAKVADDAAPRVEPTVDPAKMDAAVDGAPAAGTATRVAPKPTDTILVRMEGVLGDLEANMRAGAKTNFDGVLRRNHIDPTDPAHKANIDSVRAEVDGFEKAAQDMATSEGITVAEARKRVAKDVFGEPATGPAAARAADGPADPSAPFKGAKIATPTERAASTSTMEFKKGVTVSSKIDKDYKPPAKVFLYDDASQSAIGKFFWPNNHSPLRVLTKHWHRSSNLLYKQWKARTYSLFGGEPPPAEMSKYIPRMFIPERFLRPTIREMDKAVNAAGLIPETVKLEKALMAAADALSGAGSIEAKREAAKKIIGQSFADYAERNKEGLAMMQQAAEARLKELEAFRNAKDGKGNDLRLEKTDVASGDKRLKKLPGEELISERQYQATKKYLEDMRDMAAAMAKGNAPDNDLMNQFLKKASESDNGTALAIGIGNKIGRLGTDVRTRLADHYKGESGPLMDRDGKVVDRALPHSDVVGRVVYKLESELEAGLYIRSIRWEKAPPASNVENRFSQFVHYNDSSRVEKTSDGSPLFKPTDENEYKAMVEEYFDSDIPAHAIHGVYMILMTQGIGKTSPLPTSLKSHMITMANANKGTARGEWAEAMASRIDEVLEQAYRFGERDITKNHLQLQLWEYYKRCGYISAGQDQKWGIWGIPMNSIAPYPGAPAKIVIGNKQAEITRNVKAYLLGQEVWTKKDPEGNKLDTISSYSNPWFKMRPASTTPEGKEFLKKKGVAEGAHVEDKWNDRAPRAFKILDNLTGGSAKDLMATGGLWSRETGFNKNFFFKYYANVGVYGGALAGSVAGVRYALGDEEGAKDTMATYGNVLTAPIRYGLQGSTYLMGGTMWGLGHIPDYAAKGIHAGLQAWKPETFGTGPATDGIVRKIGAGIWDSAPAASSFIDDYVRFGDKPSRSEEPKKDDKPAAAAPAGTAPAAAAAPAAPGTTDQYTADAAKTLGFGKLEDLKTLGAIKQESAGTPAKPKDGLFGSATPAVPGNVDVAVAKAGQYDELLKTLAARGKAIDDAIATFEATDPTKANALKLLKEQHRDLLVRMQANPNTDEGVEVQEQVKIRLAQVKALGDKIKEAQDADSARILLGQQREHLLKLEAARLQAIGTVAAVDAALASGQSLTETTAAAAEREKRKKAEIDNVTTLAAAKSVSEGLAKSGQEAFTRAEDVIKGLKSLDTQMTDRVATLEGDEKKKLEETQIKLRALLAAVEKKEGDSVTQLQERFLENNKKLQALFTQVSAISEIEKLPTAKAIILDQRQILAQMNVDVTKLDAEMNAFKKAFETKTTYVAPVVAAPAAGTANNGSGSNGTGTGTGTASDNKTPQTPEQAAIAAIRAPANPKERYGEMVNDYITRSGSGNDPKGLKQLYDETKAMADKVRVIYEENKIRGAIDPKTQAIMDDATAREAAAANALRIALDAQKKINELNAELAKVAATTEGVETAKRLQAQMREQATLVLAADGKSGALIDGRNANAGMRKILDDYPYIERFARDKTIHDAGRSVATGLSGTDSQQSLANKLFVGENGAPTLLDKFGKVASGTFTGLTNWWDKVGDAAQKKGPNHKTAFQIANAGVWFIGGMIGFNIVTSILDTLGIKTADKPWIKWVAMAGILAFAMNRDGKVANKFDAMDNRNRDADLARTSTVGQVSTGTGPATHGTTGTTTDGAAPAAAIQGKNGALKVVPMPDTSGAPIQSGAGEPPRTNTVVDATAAFEARRLAAQTAGGRHASMPGADSAEVVPSGVSGAESSDVRLVAGRMPANDPRFAMAASASG